MVNDRLSYQYPLPPPMGEVAARRADGEGCFDKEHPLSHG